MINSTKTIPYSAGAPIVGHFLKYSKDPAIFFHQISQEAGDIIRINILGKKIILINHPNYIQEVLVKSVQHFRKSSSYDHLKLLLGEGLLTSEGETWKTSRKIVQPNFRKRNLQSMSFVIQNFCDRHLKDWENELSNSTKAVIDISNDMLDLSLQIAAKALLNLELTLHTNKIKFALLNCMNYVYARMEQIIPTPNWIPSGKSKNFQKEKKVIDKAIYAMIEEKKNQPTTNSDLIGEMIVAAEDGNTAYNDQGVRDDLITLFLSGFETTATALSWILYLIAKHPEVQQKVQVEVDQITEADLNTEALWRKTTFLTAVVKETLRLYPPVWSFSRTANLEMNLGDFSIKKDQMVVICPYSLHRHPAFWENPNTFLPERFIKYNLDSYTYIPFGAGPRQCIGNQFAYQEMLTFLIKTCQQYNLNPIPNQSLKFKPGITLRTKESLKVEISKRN